jgi:hypothetical protein
MNVRSLTPGAAPMEIVKGTDPASPKSNTSLHTHMGAHKVSMFGQELSDELIAVVRPTSSSYDGFEVMGQQLKFAPQVPYNMSITMEGHWMMDF